MKSVKLIVRRLRSPGLRWFVASAVLSLVGSAGFNGAGMKDMAELGVVGGFAAVAMILVFFG